MWFEDGSVDEWLENNKPSQIKQSDGFGWIAAYRNRISNEASGGKDVDLTTEKLDAAGIDSKYEDALKIDSEHNSDNEKKAVKKALNVGLARDEWESLGKDAKIEDAFRIASKYGLTVGKWMIFTHTNAVDLIWKKIIQSMFDDKLKHVTSAKVSPLEDTEGEPFDKKHVICVYNENFLDKKEVFEAESSIRNVYPRGMLTYKPDIFTYLGIYRQNQWNIKPTLHGTQGSFSSTKSNQFSRARIIDQHRNPNHGNQAKPKNEEKASQRRNDDAWTPKNSKAFREAQNSGPSIDDWMGKRMSKSQNEN